jgi:uncharacterized protein
MSKFTNLKIRLHGKLTKFLLPNEYKDKFLPTWGAHRFQYDNPSPEHVSIEDIAVSLSRQARFNGHTKFPYWVATHAVDVSRLVAPEYALPALLHDSAESYMGDMIAPLKGYFRGIWEDIEGRVEKAIITSINKTENFQNGQQITYLMNEWIKAADLTALKTEALVLCADNAKDWKHIEKIEASKYPILELTPDQSYNLFMDRYRELVALRKKM